MSFVGFPLPKQTRLSRRFRMFLTVTCLTLLYVHSSLAGTKAAKQDAAAIDILTKSLATMTGEAPLVEDTVANGKITYADGTAATLKIESKGSTELRNDTTFADHVTSFVMSSGQGHYVKSDKKTNLPLWSTQYHYPEHIPAISQMSAFTLSNMNVTYVGLEKLNDEDVHHISMTLAPVDDTPADTLALITEFHVFIDVNTMLVSKAESYIFSSDAIENRTLVEIYYSDYRSVQGLQVPFQISRYTAGQHSCDIVLSEVELNTGLGDGDFQ